MRPGVRVLHRLKEQAEFINLEQRHRMRGYARNQALAAGNLFTADKLTRARRQQNILVDLPGMLFTGGSLRHADNL